MPCGVSALLASTFETSKERFNFNSIGRGREDSFYSCQDVGNHERSE